MKKIFAAILALSLLLTACSGASSSAPAPSSQPEAASSSQEAPSASSGETLKIGLVQMMEHPSLDEIREAFLAELKAQGYDDSKVVIDYQNGQGDMGTLNTIAQKFVGDGVDMIVAIATPAAQAAAAATDSTPIIFSAVTDPVDAGLVSDLEAPDRNLTGTSDAIPVDRIFALADELTPGIKTYGLLYNNGESNSVSVIRDVKVALNAAGIAFEEATVINSSEVTTAAQSTPSSRRSTTPSPTPCPTSPRSPSRRSCRSMSPPIRWSMTAGWPPSGSTTPSWGNRQPRWPPRFSRANRFRRFRCRFSVSTPPS